MMAQVKVMNRNCFCCGSSQTWQDRKHGWYQWYMNCDTRTGNLIGYLCSKCNQSIMGGGQINRDIKSRQCFACCTRDTRMITKASGKRSAQWCTNLPTPFVLCYNCYSIIINRMDRKEFMDKWNSKRLLFKDGRIALDKNPRMGICSRCKRTVASGEIRCTNMHHIEYNDSDPLANTVELCPSCHAIVHARGAPGWKEQPN